MTDVSGSGHDFLANNNPSLTFVGNICYGLIPLAAVPQKYKHMGCMRR